MFNTDHPCGYNVFTWVLKSKEPFPPAKNYRNVSVGELGLLLLALKIEKGNNEQRYADSL